MTDDSRVSNLIFAEQDSDGGLVALRVQAAGLFGHRLGYYVLEHYDSDLNLLRSAKLTIDDARIIDLIVHDGNAILLEHHENKDSDQFEYSIITIDLSDFTEERHHLLSIDNTESRFGRFLSGVVTTSIDLGNLDMILPPLQRIDGDANYIVLYFPEEESNSLDHRVVVYDLNFEQVLDKTFPHTRESETFIVRIIAVDDQTGVVYIMGVDYFGNSPRSIRRGRQEYLFTVYRIDESGVTHQEFRPEGKYVGDMVMLINENGLYFVGSYSRENNDNQLGMAYIHLDLENLDIKKETIHGFPKEAYKGKHGNRKGTRRHNSERGLKDMVFRDYYLDDKGNIFFTAEEYGARVSYSRSAAQITFNNPEGTYLRSENRFYHIYVGKINSSGEIEWMSTVNKEQHPRRADMELLSFSSLLSDGKIYLFFNAHRRVRESRDGRHQFFPAPTPRLNLYMVELDGKNIDYRNLIGHRDSDFDYKILQAVNWRGEKLFIEGKDGNDKQILKLGL